MVNDFVFELGCEELPSGSVLPLANEFADNVLAALDKAQLAYGEVKRFATPRRIGLVVNDLQSEQLSQRITRKGPAFIAAYDKEGKPTPALMGFAKSCGVTVDKLSTIQTDKGDWIVYDMQTPGSKTKDILPGLITQALSALSIAKPMRWGNSDDEFARPVHWAVFLLGNEVINHPILGVVSSNQSRGHRFHHALPITIESAKTYESQLQSAFVLADFSKRRETIVNQVQELAAKYDAIAVMPEDLIDEVCSIVEWPQALLADFKTEFLEVPAEALIASMQSHQKCFALKSKAGALMPHFITVANINSSKPQQVILGNEKVMRARLSDAAFFFLQDKKQKLDVLIPATERVVFQVKLGTLKEKSSRIKALMIYFSQALHLAENQAVRAAELSKCDLMTGMVGEFPELQGLMGYYYALHDGEDLAVAKALNEQYMPRFAADSLPESDLGLALSLADRLDTLVGIFAIGQKPSGVKDPFKLRRHALAVVRMLVLIPAPLTISGLLAATLNSYGDTFTVDTTLLGDLKAFILDRLSSYYQSQGIANDLLLAVRARQDECLYDLDKRLQALQIFVSMPEAAALSAACKRVNNLLNHAGNLVNENDVNPDLLEAGSEQSLYACLNSIENQVEAMYCQGDYGSLLKQLASLREPVDAYFDNVMVMVEDERIKKNRLALLARLQTLLQGVADISLLQLS